MPRAGVRADRRLPPALTPGALRLERGTLAERLAAIAAFADNVSFADEEGGVGTWARLFDHEPAVIMAEILAFEPAVHSADFAERLETDLDAAAAALRQLARKVESWLGRLAAGGERRVHAHLAAGSGLQPAVLRGLARAEPTPAAMLAVLEGPLEGDVFERARLGLRRLRATHEGLLGMVGGLAALAGALLAERLGSGDVDPAVGLLVAEMRLLAEAEAVINRIPDRHTGYYFRTVLGQAPRPARPERVLLRFDAGAASVVVPEGARLVARMPGTATALHYRLTEPVRVAPVAVAEARALRYDRDRMISPLSEMGFVTGVRAATLALDGRDGGQRLFTPAADGAAPFGLAVASPMLFLAEGQRRVEMRLVVARRREGGSVSDDPAAVIAEDHDLAAAFGFGTGPEAGAAVERLVAALPPEATALGAAARVYWACGAAAGEAEQIRAVIGRLVTATLVEGARWPEGLYRDAVLERAAALLGSEEAAVVGRMFDRPRAEVFRNGLHDAFQLTVSTPQGEAVVPAVQVQPLTQGSGIAFRFMLEETAPPLVAPPGEAAPVVTIRTAPEARFSPISLFERFMLASIGISVAVEGLNRLTAFSDDGPVDVAQPFLPFGARAKDGAVFLVGAREMALKPVTRVAAKVTWADLPPNGGGWREYYRAYGRDFTVPDPALRLDYLSGEGWRPLAGAPVPLATTSAPDAPLQARRRLEAMVPGRPEAARVPPGEAEFRQRQSIRAGLIGLTLVCPGDGFGHAAYPAALARAMRPRMVRRVERPLPPPPYAPAVTAISLDYAAEAVIALGAPAAARAGERVVQIGAFGRQEIFPARTRPGAGFFPARLADGTLFLRLSGPEARGLVSLAFEMAESSHQRVAFAQQPVAWHYLTDGGWVPLPAAALSADTTDGLMRSGLVSLDLPDDAVLSATEMPGEGAWLAIAANAHLDAFPRLVGVAANGARAVRIDPGADRAQPGAARWSLDPPVAGLGGIVQVGAPFGGAPAESEEAFRARVSERLRHRQRAVTAWDVERLVLEAFPEVWQAKCFPLLDRSGARQPGAFTLVAVPAPPAGADDRPDLARAFDVLTLQRIEDHLAERTSAFARVAVRNPSFERIQVRARVGFGRGADEGALVRRLKLELARFLSVWSADAPLASFGWAVNLNDVGAFLSERPYVEFLTDFSILHLLADDGGRYRLHDTARSEPGAQGTTGGRMLTAAEPWSLALPMRDHWIAPARDRATREPGAAGIGGLGIGETLVVGEGSA
jgi:hypothetical protein